MDVIKLLPDSVANQIAAGEVIQRPASVVKELVENSIDAGATTVQINVKDAGRTLIQIVDNGCGMSTTDARMAFERHATSKIRQATDLMQLHTMGFRGEALPSVAAVSEIDMRTMRRDDEMGTHLVISASKVESQQPEAMVPGTNIMVKRLFFNLPARRKFLKKDPVELSHIVREFERLALVNTGVEFTLTHNDVLLHKLSPGTMKQRIAQLFGKNMEHQLLPIGTETSIVKIEGFVGLPSNARRRGVQQFFFVNGRHMRHPYFHKAVISCYDNLIASDTQPNYFINFTVDPDTIDVNIHPQKYEIKFENEQPVWQILQAAVKESLGRFNVSSALDFDPIDIPEIPAMNSGAQFDIPGEDADPNFNPFDTDAYSKPRQPSTGMPSTFNSFENTGHHSARINSDWEKLYAGFTSERGSSSTGTPTTATSGMRGSALNDLPTPPAPPVTDSELTPEIPSMIDAVQADMPTMQIGARYIARHTRDGLMLIDQHRAHTLVLYERFMAMTRAGSVPSQRLIFPEAVTLDAAQHVIVTSISEQLQTMGFDISHLGNNAWAINSVPSILGNTNPCDALVNIINAVSEADEDIEKSQWQKIALSVARSSAIKYGTVLKREEIDRLIDDLLSLQTPGYTPDGRTVLTTISVADINRLFA